MYPQIVPDTTYGRVYEVAEGIYFPSVSTIPSYGMPTDPFLLKWYIEQSQGDYDRHTKYNGQASEVGTFVHDCIDKMLEGEEIKISSNPLDHIKGKGYYPTYKASVEIKKALASYVAWHNIHKPKIIAKEQLLCSLDKKGGNYKFPFAGRCDMVAEINNELWMLDIKTSKVVENKPAMQCQLSIYKMLWDANYERKIDRLGIIWAKKDYKRNTPPTSVKKTYEYQYDEELVCDTYKMFNRFYDGFERGLGKPKQYTPLADVFKLEI
tara:strand:- start:738 stop:1535 length:798 start_codon:yes stop_codon:yes gene_type:complete